MISHSDLSVDTVVVRDPLVRAYHRSPVTSFAVACPIGEGDML
jgi:hypothetical protein